MCSETSQGEVNIQEGTIGSFSEGEAYLPDWIRDCMEMMMTFKGQRECLFLALNA